MTDPPRQRDVLTLALPSWGAVVPTAGLGWHVIGEDGQPEEVIRAFLLELAATGASVPTRRSYSYDLLRWWRFCAAVGVPWRQAFREEVRDFVRWLQGAANAQRRRSQVRSTGNSRPPAGTLNAVTGKPYLAEGYAPRTINHALTVVSAFYDFAVVAGLGPLTNPVPQQSGRTGGGHGLKRRGTYRQRPPVTQPRAISEELLQDLFAVLGNDRDRALVAVTLSSGVRASELLSMTRYGVNSGE